MAEEYIATDKRNGLEVTVRGEFPAHRDERIRIARTTNLFVRLVATILITENESQRRERFFAIETQLEMADALIREDLEEVQRLMRATMEKMGIGQDQLDELARKIVEQFGDQPPRIGDEPGPEPEGPFPIV